MYNVHIYVCILVVMGPNIHFWGAQHDYVLVPGPGPITCLDLRGIGGPGTIAFWAFREPGPMAFMDVSD